ncbi:MAG: IS1595 family transposase [Syntrophaceae bacterium]|nr:IS1595 family transposase [Syntrophaceae bacterium]
MSTANRYAKRSKISEAKFRELVRYFALDLDAHKIAALTRLNRNTVNRYLLRIRERIAEHCEEAFPTGGTGAGGTCSSGGRRGRIPVIGIFERGGRVSAGFVLEGDGPSGHGGGPADILRPDAWRGYGGLGDETDAKDGHRGADGRADGIRSFRRYARRRLAKFRGVPGSTFYLHLKECEFRFNCRNRSMYLVVLKLLRENPLS